MLQYPLHQVYFYLTEGCNLRCRHCWLAPPYEAAAPQQAVLDVELFREIIRQGKPLGLRGVKLTGGEPLLHPAIRTFLQIVREAELRLTIETNGVLCTADIACDLAQSKEVFVSVSIDGANAATHDGVRGVKGAFAQAIAGVRNLVQAEIKPQIIMSLMPVNKDQMTAMVQMAKELGAGSVKFNLIQPTARGARLHARGETLAIAELIELGRWAETELSTSAGLPVVYHHPPAFRPLSRMFGEHGDGCQTCGILGILGVLANGSYALCGIGAMIPELIFGHAVVDQLAAVWYDHPVLNEIRAGLPKRLQGVCGGCVMQTYCLGGCLAQNYYRSHDLWASYWFCQAAYEQGLFPQNRLKI